MPVAPQAFVELAGMRVVRAVSSEGHLFSWQGVGTRWSLPAHSGISDSMKNARVWIHSFNAI